MVWRISDEIASNPPHEASLLSQLMHMVQPAKTYSKLVERAMGQSQQFEQRKALLQAGHFAMMDLLSLLIHLDESPRPGVRMQVVSVLLKRLVEWSLVTDNDFQLANQLVRYQWSIDRIGLFAALSLLDNVLLGRAYLVKKYAPSVPAIRVEKDNAERIGTGFLSHDHAGGKAFRGTGYVITAKHNIDPAEGIRFLGFENSTTKFEPRASEWICHPSLDIAAIPVVADSTAVPIFPYGVPALLSGTVSLGYPRIATADGPYLLAHNGELNAVVTSYLDKQEYLIVSNNVAPGNSGGPVLDDSGLCIGMIIRSLEAEHDGGSSKANAAIPAIEVQRFVSQIKQ